MDKLLRRQQQAEAIHEHAVKVTRDLPPLSDDVLERVANILRHETPPELLTTWRLLLFCGCLVDKTAHSSYDTVERAFGLSTSCPDCGRRPVIIVDSEKLP